VKSAVKSLPESILSWFTGVAPDARQIRHNVRGRSSGSDININIKIRIKIKTAFERKTSLAFCLTPDADATTVLAAGNSIGHDHKTWLGVQERRNSFLRYTLPVTH